MIRRLDPNKEDFERVEEDKLDGILNFPYQVEGIVQNTIVESLSLHSIKSHESTRNSSPKITSQKRAPSIVRSNQESIKDGDGEEPLHGTYINSHDL